MRSVVVKLVAASALVAALPAAPSVLPAGPAEAAVAAPEGSQGVRPQLRRVDLGGVDRPSLSAARPAQPANRQADLTEAGVSPSALDADPELLTAQTDTARFDAVGISWSGDAGEVAVWVRVREDRGWSDWNLLPAVDIAPDADTPEAAAAGGRTFSEPLLTDGAAGFQVRIDATGPVRGVRADLIDAGRTDADASIPSGPASRPAPGPATGAPRPRAAAAAATAVSAPAFISRAQWGADESLRTGTPAYASEIKVGVVHHTASTNSYSADTAAAEIRAIYAYHTLSLGWSDIAYNFLVDRFGRVFEGRAGGLDRPVIGAATGGFNRYTFSVSALGDYGAVGAPAPMVDAIVRVIAWKFTIHHVDPNATSTLTSGGADNSRYSAGQQVTVPNIIAHRDMSYTACPGANLYGLLPSIKAQVRALLPAGLVHPSAEVTPRTPTANGSIRVRSGLIYGGNWSVRVQALDGTLIHQRVGTGWSVDVTWSMTTATGQPVADSTYRITVESEQNGTSAHPWSEVASTSSLFGNLESVRVTPTGTIAGGWAAISSGSTATVALTVDGAVATRVQATASRPDVGAAYPALGPDRGFSTPLTMSPGVHLVCAWAEGTNLLSALIGCRWIDNLRDEPIGNFEATGPLPGGVRVSGWALDRHTSGSIGVRIYVDGRWGADGTASRSRPDVGAAFPGYGANHGFQIDVNTGPGAHHICINGLNAGAGASEGFIGCQWTSAATGPPTGAFDAVGTVAGETVVAGWALDPDTVGPVDVHVYVDGAFATVARADRQRPDLAPYFPFMGTAHGYEARFGALPPGSHTVCVFAINAGPPGPNPLLGCRAHG